VLRTLLQRGYVVEVGRDPGPGQAVLYGTTSVFLERMGLDRIEQLPPLADFVPGPEVMEALEHSLRADPPRTMDAAAPDGRDGADELATGGLGDEGVAPDALPDALPGVDMDPPSGQ
jgi:segregation and condensation protein B